MTNEKQLTITMTTNNDVVILDVTQSETEIDEFGNRRMLLFNQIRQLQQKRKVYRPMFNGIDAVPLLLGR
jgi:hypothetical protein